MVRHAHLLLWDSFTISRGNYLQLKVQCLGDFMARQVLINEMCVTRSLVSTLGIFWLHHKHVNQEISSYETMESYKKKLLTGFQLKQRWVQTYSCRSFWNRPRWGFRYPNTDAKEQSPVPAPFYRWNDYCRSPSKCDLYRFIPNACLIRPYKYICSRGIRQACQNRSITLA